MKAWELVTLDKLRSSFWLVPTALSLMGGVFAAGCITLDFYVETEQATGFQWLRAGDPEAVRTLLAAFMSSIVTIISIVFSITVVALQLASSQFGPRMLRNYMRDRGTQVVLGVFIATFVYCLVVMTTMGRLRNEASVPHISTLGGAVLTLLSVGVLIYFIHHIARMISAAEVVMAVFRELCTVADRLYPNPLDPTRQEPVKPEPPRDPREAYAVCAPASSYLQSVEYAELAELAEQADLTMQVLYRPGLFVVEGHALVRVWPAERMDAELQKRIIDSFYLGAHRTPTQDVEFAVSQLTEIAVRALSPGINDPFTAINCIDHLTAGLAIIARREMEGPTSLPEPRRLRLTTDRTTFEGLVNAAFDQVRQNGKSHPAVMIRILEGIQRIAVDIQTEHQRAALKRQADLVLQDGREAITNAADRHDLEQRHAEALARIVGDHDDAKPAG